VTITLFQMFFSLFCVMCIWYWRYVSYLKEEIFKMDNILKNAIFDDFQKRKKNHQNWLIFTKSSSNGTIIIVLAFGKYLIRNS